MCDASQITPASSLGPMLVCPVASAMIFAIPYSSHCDFTTVVLDFVTDVPCQYML